MENILKTIDFVRHQIKRGPADTLLLQKPFAKGMYKFSTFMLDYYARVREQLNIDYDSFMIVQTVVSHILYNLTKNKGSSSYSDLESEWKQLINSNEPITAVNVVGNYKNINQNEKLTVSSICLVIKLPKETVRRKTRELQKKGILRITKKNGIVLGQQYKVIFKSFVPQTTLEVAKLVKDWEKSGILKSLVEFKV